MAENATVARPYAEALFLVAKLGDLGNWSILLAKLKEVGAHPDILALVSNPKIDQVQIVDVLTELVKAQNIPELKNFLVMLVENSRVPILPDIAAQFESLVNVDQGVDDVEIETAFDLSQSQVNDLVAVLEKKFGKKLKPRVTLESALIGGVRITVGDEVMDRSIRARLDTMRQTLIA